MRLFIIIGALIHLFSHNAMADCIESKNCKVVKQRQDNLTFNIKETCTKACPTSYGWATGSCFTDNGHEMICECRCYSPPEGPYKETCKEIALNGKNLMELEATCKREDQSLYSSSLDMQTCDDEIYNCSGKLECGYCTYGKSAPHH